MEMSSSIIIRQKQDRMNEEQFGILVRDLVARMEYSFTQLQKSNDPGRITVQRVSPTELQVKVTKVGTYRFYCDSGDNA